MAPFKTFQAMWDAEAAQQISPPESRCFLDQNSLKLVNDAGGNFGDEESKLKLYCLALKSRTDIDHLESLHAWVRKVLAMRTQGWGMNMQDLQPDLTPVAEANARVASGRQLGIRVQRSASIAIAREIEPSPDASTRLSAPTRAA